MAFFDDKENLHPKVKPLTQGEAAWIRRLEKALLACPSDRLKLVTIGDAGLTVTDADVELDEDLEIHDGRASRNGLRLATLRSKPQISGVSG